MTAPVYRCRLAKPDDLVFVVSSWIDSYRSSHSAGIMSISPLEAPCPTCSSPVPYDYETVMGHTIRQLLERPGVSVRVAENPRAQPPNNLHGYLVSEVGANIPSYPPPTFQLRIRESPDPLVHYVFVKQLYRGWGIARALFAAAGIDPSRRFLYSCKTPVVASLEGVDPRAEEPGVNRIPAARWAPLSVRFAKPAKKAESK